LLHVVDITHPNVQAQAESVHETLIEIDADHIPVLVALNKIDRLSDPERAKRVLAAFPKAVAISALTGENITELLTTIGQILYEKFEPISVRLPYNEGALIALFHEQGQVQHIEHDRKDVVIQGKIPIRLIARYKPFIIV